MGNLSKMLSALWGILGILALLTLFTVYANFPENGTLDLLQLNKAIILSRQQFFFVFSGIFFAVNLVILLAIRSLDTFRKLTMKIHPDQRLKLLVAVKTMACGANFFLIVLMLVLKFSMDGDILPVIWSAIFLWLGPITILAGLSYLTYILLKPVKAT